MDSRHFDALTRHLTEVGTRRGLLGVLATLPVLGGLFALLDLDDGGAQGRRRRRKKRHKHGRGRRKRHTHCKANSKVKTCAGKCGIVTNNCQKKVDCGSCCVPDCAGKVCDDDGCGGECGPGCAPCETCFQGECFHVCDGSDCCDNGICTEGKGDSACGRDGDLCVTCTPPQTCGGGNPGTPGVCG
jgi:hypothetical protein